MSPRFPRERSSPFTRAVISRRRSPSSSGVTMHRAETGGEVLAFRRPEPDGHLHLLEVAGRPVVQDREAGEAALRPRRPPPPRARSPRPSSRPGTRSRPRARRSPPRWRSRRPGCGTTRVRPRARAAPGRPARAARRRRSRARPEGGESAPAGARRASACPPMSPPPPSSQAARVGASSSTTRSPSMRPGAIRPSASKVQSLTGPKVYAGSAARSARPGQRCLHVERTPRRGAGRDRIRAPLTSPTMGDGPCFGCARGRGAWKALTLDH